MANEIWTIKRCLEWTKEYLAERGEEHPRLSAEWLLCAATGLARIDLYIRMDETLNAAQLETMHAAVVRRAKGEPLQYITGSTQFRMIDVACAPGVLIPRPETEMLVEEVLNYLDAEVLSPEAAARQRVELPWNDEVEQARKAEAALADERATAERRAANLTAADEAALGSDVLGSRAYAGNWPTARPRKPPHRQRKPRLRKLLSPSSTNTASPSRVPTRRRFQLRMPLRLPQPSPALLAFSRSAAARAASRSLLLGSAAATLPAPLPILSRVLSIWPPKTATRSASRQMRLPSASPTW